ncbi:25.3 kDa vesicle transport protein SEC22-1 [Typha angustifolia]|uniref:25.3 kDa vesicle transport protein SEC22-1 n=1 Tax=Typha angustifolia TaxID=59011 RepID=UPI003C301768
MVKLTLVGRLSDGMPISQTPTYLNEEDGVSSFYRQQAELVLKEISRGALKYSKMSILIDHHCFHYLMGNGVCYITLCESWYPRKLAFHYLNDLKEEFEKVDVAVVDSVLMPYALRRFDYVIGNVRRRYVDTRTQANLNKLKSDRQQDLDIVTEEFSKVISKHQRPGFAVSSSEVNPTKSTLWSSAVLEGIALKWMPITIFVMVAVLLLWTTIVLDEYSVLRAS